MEMIIIIINENENFFDVLSKLLVFILARILLAQFGVFFKAVSTVYLITAPYHFVPRSLRLTLTLTLKKNKI
jgi:hypothetical protein